MGGCGARVVVMGWGCKGCGKGWHQTTSIVESLSVRQRSAEIVIKLSLTSSNACNDFMTFIFSHFGPSYKSGLLGERGGCCRLGGFSKNYGGVAVVKFNADTCRLLFLKCSVTVLFFPMWKMGENPSPGVQTMQFFFYSLINFFKGLQSWRGGWRSCNWKFWLRARLCKKYEPLFGRLYGEALEILMELIQDFNNNFSKFF